MTKRKCSFCDATTTESLNEFYSIGWNAYSLGNETSRCACPKHTELLRQEMRDRLEIKNVKP